MRTFNFKSYWNTFKWMMFSSYRELLTTFGAVILGTFILEEFMVSPAFNRYNGDVQTLNTIMIFTMFTFLGSLWTMYGASRTFGDIKSRHSAITMLMHPATNLEKFVARVTYYTFLWTLIAIIGFVIGDVVRYCFNAVTGWNYGTPLLIVSGGRIARFMYDDQLTPDLIAEVGNMVFAVLIWGHSVFVLGSAFFRPNRFLLTSITLCIIQTLLGTFIPTNLGMKMLDSTFSTVDILPCILLAALHYWLAYKLFTRMQVINNKWINL